MKKIILVFILSSFSVFLLAQDIIITQDNETIKAIIVTEYEAVIKYALYDDPDGPTHLILKSKINSIAYKNGRVEYFDIPSVSTPANPNIIAVDNNPVVSQEKIRNNMIRINPLVPILGAIMFGMIDIEFQYAGYIAPKVAIPIDIEFGGINDVGMVAILMTGIEVVLATHRQKSGPVLQAFVGPYINAIDVVARNHYRLNRGVWVAAKAGIGYQLVSKSGFVLNTAVGLKYNSFENRIAFNIDLNLGVAF